MMKRKASGSILLACTLAIVSCSALLCANKIVSYEDVTGQIERDRVEITVAKPTHSHQSYFTMVKYGWTGDVDGYMRVGNGNSFTVGYLQTNGHTYTEFRVPSVGSSAVDMEYYWAKSLYDTTHWVDDGHGGVTEEPIRYESQVTMYTGVTAADHTVTGSFVSGVLTHKATVSREIEFYRGKTIYITAAYGEYAADLAIEFGSAYGGIDLAVGGVVFTFYATEDYLRVMASETISLNSVVNAYNGCAAIAFAVV